MKKFGSKCLMEVEVGKSIQTGRYLPFIVWKSMWCVYFGSFTNSLSPPHNTIFIVTHSWWEIWSGFDSILWSHPKGIHHNFWLRPFYFGTLVIFGVFLGKHKKSCKNVSANRCVKARMIVDFVMDLKITSTDKSHNTLEDFLKLSNDIMG